MIMKENNVSANRIYFSLKIIFIILMSLFVLFKGFLFLNIKIYKKSPLYLASLSGNVDKVKTLIREGADVNAKTLLHRTPLHGAAMNGNPIIIQILCDNHAELNATELDKNWTPLDYAIYYKNYRAAEVLIDNGAKIDIEVINIKMHNLSREEIKDLLKKKIRDREDS